MAKTFFSACPHDCPDACAFKVDVDGGKVRIEANGRLPWTTFICPKGKRWAKRVFDARRLTSPLLRRGETFLPLPVDDALDLWAERLGRTVERDGPLSVFLYQGAGSLYFSKRLLAHPLAELGGYRTTRGSLCGSAGNAGLRETFGVVPVQSVETLVASARGLLFWGRNVAETSLHLLPLLKKIRARGGRLGAIEIRPTATTALVDRWWRIRPGSDAFLAAWLCRALLVRGLASPKWRSRVDDGQAFEAFLSGLGDDALLERTGLPSDEARDLLDWLLLDGPVTHYGGYGLQRYLHGKESYRWISALAVLTGAFDGPGGAVLMGKDEMARFPASLLPRPAETERLPVATWHEKLERLTPPIGHLIVTNANPLQQAPDEKGLRRAFDAIPFKVCLDITLTETARACDLVLPVATFLEEGPDWRGSYWHRYLLRSQAVLDPPPSVRPETALFGGLARRLGLKRDPERLMKEMDDLLLADESLEDLGDGVYAWEEPQFWSDPGARAALPLFLPEPLSPCGGLRLVTVHVASYINGQSWDAPEADEPLEARLAPAEMDRRGLADGDRVRLAARNGQGLDVEVRTQEGVGEGVVLLPQGRPGLNALTPPLSSPGFGAPYHETFVSIEARTERKAPTEAEDRTGRSGP